MKSIDAKLALVKTLWKSRAAWLGIAVATAFLFAACSSAASDPASTEPISNGAAEDVAPDFELTLFETPNHSAGEAFKLSQYQGQPVVLNFWFPSCPPCVAEMPDLEAAFQEHRVDGVEFIGVQLLGIDTAEDGQKFVDEIGVTYALGPDEDSDITIKQYEVRGFPTTLFLDKDHNIVRKWTGPLNRAKLEEFIQEMLN
ncbi:MAG: TlpA family protein disulfide reductase [Chloroflexi bacterium]|nr:TlpA family protein disulfide reductase [Chloroflexota bacterium]